MRAYVRHPGARWTLLCAAPRAERCGRLLGERRQRRNEGLLGGLLRGGRLAVADGALTPLGGDEVGECAPLGLVGGREVRCLRAQEEAVLVAAGREVEKEGVCDALRDGDEGEARDEGEEEGEEIEGGEPAALLEDELDPVQREDLAGRVGDGAEGGGEGAEEGRLCLQAAAGSSRKGLGGSREELQGRLASSREALTR